MATKKARATDYWCNRCRRPLVNGVKGKADTVTYERTYKGFIHDGCGGEVVTAGKR